jgi:hypothetical protein
MDARDDQRCAAQTTVAAARGSRREEIRDVMRRRVVVQRGYGMRCGEDVCMCFNEGAAGALGRWLGVPMAGTGKGDGCCGGRSDRGDVA